MATRTVKARVELDGEKQYKQALSDLQRGNQVLGSEMKKLEAQYKDSTESTEFLTKKGELLERQLLQQKDKVQTLREALQNAAKQYGESSDKTQDWQIKLNRAEAAQYDLERSIKENNEALKTQGSTMDGLGDTVNEFASKLGFRIPEGATKALNGMKGLSAGTVASMGAAAAAIAAVVKVLKMLHETTLEAAADADRVLTESLVTGLGTDTIQKLQYAENLIDVSYSTITSSLTKLTRNMADAQSGNKEMAASFEELGVSITNADGSLRDAEPVFYDIIDALGAMENATERDALTMSLLGKSAQELNPLIAQGSSALREYGKEAEQVGYVLDESQLKKLQEVDDAYQRMQLQIEATKKEIALEFAPASQEVMETFADLTKTAGETLAKSKILDTFVSLVKNADELLKMFKQAAESVLPPAIREFNVLKGVLYFLAMDAAVIADAFQVISGLLPWNWGSGQIKTALGYGATPSNTQRTKMIYEGTWDEYSNGSVYDNATGTYVGSAAGRETDYSWADSYHWKDDEDGWNAAGTSNWRGGMTWVGENGPELVNLPQGSQILNAQDSRNAGGNVFNITIPAKDIKEFNDIVRIVQSAKVVARMGG